MSNMPPAWVVNAALPPLLNWKNCVVPPMLVMTVALPAVLKPLNCVVPPKLAMTVALPAVLNWENWVVPPMLAMTVALPAVLLLVKVVDPRALLVMVALPAVLPLLKVVDPRALLVMFAPGRSRAEKCEEPAAIAGDGRVARRAGIVEAGEPEIGVDDGGVAGRARVEKACHRGEATGVVGNDRIAGRAVIGERQRRYGPHEEIRGIRRGVDDAGASNGEGCRAAEGK
jgi:hypothetical protein